MNVIKWVTDLTFGRVGRSALWNCKGDGGTVQVALARRGHPLCTRARGAGAESSSLVTDERKGGVRVVVVVGGT